MFETDENKTLKFLGEQNFKLPVSTQEQWWSISYFINSALIF